MHVLAVNIQQLIVIIMVIVHQIIIVTEMFANRFVIQIRIAYQMRNASKEYADQYVTVMLLAIEVLFVKTVSAH